MAGFRSTYSDRNSAALNTPLADTAVAVIEGCKTMADWDKTVQRWHREGGTRILEEFRAEYKAVNGGGPWALECVEGRDDYRGVASRGGHATTPSGSGQHAVGHVRDQSR